MQAILTLASVGVLGYSAYYLAPKIPPVLDFLSKPPPFTLQDQLLFTRRSLKGYRKDALDWARRKRRALNQLVRLHREIYAEVGIFDSLLKIEDAIYENAILADTLVRLSYSQTALESYTIKAETRTIDVGRVKELFKHLTRDWSALGGPERTIAFEPVLSILQDSFNNRAAKILLPGSGCGRLAYDIALGNSYWKVDAVELSFFMSLGARLVVENRAQVGRYHCFPWVENLSNHIDTENLLQQASFPDISIEEASNLRFINGDFLRFKSEPSSYNAIVTLFFVDTARNVVEYLERIHSLLQPGGVWINEGPLLWHDSVAELTLEQLYRLITLTGFTILDQRMLDVPYTANTNSMVAHL